MIPLSSISSTEIKLFKGKGSHHFVSSVITTIRGLVYSEYLLDQCLKIEVNYIIPIASGNSLQTPRNSAMNGSLLQAGSLRVSLEGQSFAQSNTSGGMRTGFGHRSTCFPNVQAHTAQQNKTMSLCIARVLQRNRADQECVSEIDIDRQRDRQKDLS